MDKELNILKESIDKAVRSALRENTINEIIDSIISEQIQNITEDKEKTNKKRSVLQWLKRPEVNTAEIRRKMEGEPDSQEEEDSKRSYFMKKVNQSNGKDFTDKEVNRLYAIKNNMGQ